MITDYEDIALELLGEPFRRLLARQDLQELSVNYSVATSSCPVFVDRGAGPMQATGFVLEARCVEAFIRLLASAYGKVIDSDEPFLNLILRNGGRFSACKTPAADGPGFTIRFHWLAGIPLDRAQDDGNRSSSTMRFGLNIVVVGGTGARKTTFLNALIAYLQKLSPHERLGSIEDELELQISALNLIRRVVRGGSDMRRHVREMLRMRPDRIIVGEVRGAEALDLLKA